MISQQTFPVLNFDGDEVAFAPREKVHQQGLWHRATNCFVIRKSSSGKIEVLMQRRSELVDISKSKLDQSCATQVVKEDKSLKETVLRGLEDELGILSDDIVVMAPFNQDNSFRITKTYHDQPEIFNREIVISFAVLIDTDVEPQSLSPKVVNVNWLKLDQLSDLVHRRPGDFTKTARSLFLDTSIAKSLTSFLSGFSSNNGNSLFSDRYHFFSFNDFDAVVAENGNGSYNITIYDTNGPIKERGRLMSTSIPYHLLAGDPIEQRFSDFLVKEGIK